MVACRTLEHFLDRLIVNILQVDILLALVRLELLRKDKVVLQIELGKLDVAESCKFNVESYIL